MQVPLAETSLGEYLSQRGVVRAGEVVLIEPAGDGNINWVRRARTLDGTRSWIVKQARPALERFPQYQAPTERIVFEARYYERTRHLAGGSVCPRILLFDEPQRVLVLEDLGHAPRFDELLARGEEHVDVCRALGSFLGAVHAATRDPQLAAEFHNDGMRRLHGDHIFVLPFHANDFPLAPAVRARAEALQQDADLVRIAATAYERYLEPRGALVHADVQAGNVLVTPAGPKLLDAEIAHVGDPAFDLGTLLAHLLLYAVAHGDPQRATASACAAWEAYGAAHSGSDGPRFVDVARYAGIEMMRRTIGAARVAAVHDPDAAAAAIDLAKRLMRHPAEGPERLAV